MKNISTKKIIIALAIVESLALIPTVLYIIFYK